MLADDVGRRAHLKVILLVNARHQIGVVERDAIVGVGAEEERLRRLRAGLGWINVRPERQNARLREVPAGLVQFEVELKRSRFVSARMYRWRLPVSSMQGSAKGAPGFRGSPLRMKLAGVPSGLKLGCKRFSW